MSGQESVKTRGRRFFSGMRMATIVQDTFTDADGTALTSHAGEVGATWTTHPNFSAGATISDANRLRNDSGSNRIAYASATPPTADYSGSFDLRCVTMTGLAGVCVRLSTSAATYYLIDYEAGLGQWKLYAVVNFGTVGAVQTYAQTLTPGTTYAVSWTLIGNTLTVYIDGVQRMQRSDAVGITAAGKVGVFFSGAASNTTGLHIDNLQATGDTPLTTGTASVTGIGSGQISLACTAPSGGTSPYSYQWQRSTTIGSGFSNLSGATSQTLTDTGLSNGTTYYYRCQQTDSAGSPATVTTAEVSGMPEAMASVTNSGLFFSPYNWDFNGSVSCQATSAGAYFLTKFSKTACRLYVDVSDLVAAGVSAGNYPKILYSVDGGAYQSVQLTSASLAITLATGLADATHTLEVIFTGIFWNSNDRWTNPTMKLKVLGFGLDSGAAFSAPTTYSGRMIVYGDSEGEGWEVLGSGVFLANQDASLAFPLILRRALQCEVGVVCFAGQGYTVSVATANVPALTSAWNLYSAGRSRLVSSLLSPAPDYIVSCHGQNDSGALSANVQTAISTLISAWRTAAPNAKIAICSNPTYDHQTAINAAVAAAANSKVKAIDLGEVIRKGSFQSGSHLSQRGQTRYGSQLATGIQNAFPASTGGGISRAQLVNMGA
jgi:hypothetical protein